MVKMKFLISYNLVSKIFKDPNQ